MVKSNYHTGTYGGGLHTNAYRSIPFAKSIPSLLNAAFYGGWRLVLIILLQFSCLQIAAQKAKIAEKPKPIRLTIQFDDLPKNDSLTLQIFQNTLSNSSGSRSMSQPAVHTAFRNKKGFFQFATAPFNEPCYLSVGYGANITSIDKSLILLLNLYLAEPGDDIKISIVKDSLYDTQINKRQIKINDAYFSYIYQNTNYSIYFSGNGSTKYQCRYIADRSASAYGKIASTVFDLNGNKKDTHMDHMKAESISLVKKYKHSMSSMAYNTLYADFIGKYDGDWYRLFSFKWYDRINKIDTTGNKNGFNENAMGLLWEKINTTRKELPELGKKFSVWYPYYLIQMAVATTRIKNKDASANDNSVYEIIRTTPDKQLRDKILTTYLLDWYIYLKNGQDILRDALTLVSTGYYEQLLQELDDQQTKGKPAYNFSLTDTKGRTVKLEDFSGKVVFIDFWYTACSNCIIYYKTVLSGVEDEFRNNPDIKFLTINVDTEKERWIQSVHSGKYTSEEHAINLFTNGAGIDHDVIRYYKVMGYPRPLLIDKKGNIFSASASDLRNKERLRALLEAVLNNPQNDNALKIPN